MNLNIGCGSLIQDSWLNLDLHPGPGAFYVNVMDGLPLSDQSVEHIHCEHFLEHLDDALGFLRECHRVLQRGGSLRVIVPDAEKYLRAYTHGQNEFFHELEHLGNAVEPLDTPMKVINQMFRMGGAHRFAWDFETLEQALRAAGFSEVERSSFSEVAEQYRIDGSDSWRPHESLYLNARKGGNP